MEIERKFLISGFPEDLPQVYAAHVEQGYLSTDPTVRIRCNTTAEGTSCKLCFKGEGTLVRREVELDIAMDVYREIKEILQTPVVVKDFRVYEIPGGYRLECSHVDPGSPTAFYYAEVEFETVEQANAFVPPPFIMEDVTEDRSYAMAAYWERTRKGTARD